MSADPLRRAAELMREYACRGIAWEEPWDGDYAADKGWLAPDVALHLADWLDREADEVPPHATHYRDVPLAEAPAFRVARAYLGESA